MLSRVLLYRGICTDAIIFQVMDEISFNLGELDLTSEDFLLDEVDGKHQIPAEPKIKNSLFGIAGRLTCFAVDQLANLYSVILR